MNRTGKLAHPVPTDDELWESDDRKSWRDWVNGNRSACERIRKAKKGWKRVSGGRAGWAMAPCKECRVSVEIEDLNEDRVCRRCARPETEDERRAKKSREIVKSELQEYLKRHPNMVPVVRMQRESA